MSLNGGGDAAAFRLVTLGAVRLVNVAGRDVAPGQRKLLALLAYLAQKAPRSASRDELATLMWGERAEENARGSLRQALFQLKRLVGDALEVTPGAAVVSAGAIDLDASAFEADIAGARFREAAMRWGGEFLAGVEDAGGGAFSEWLEVERVRLRRLLTSALEELTSAAAARGAWAEAATWAERWAGAVPLEERAHRRLVESLALAGRTAEALARHAGYIARHHAELGAGPSEDFLRLAAQLERRARAGDRSASALRGAAALSVPEMVGRDAAFAELTSAWREARRGQPVAIVIEGDAGVGKTRLADEFLRTVESGRGRAVVLRARAYAADRDVRLSTARELLSRVGDAPGLLGASRAALSEIAALVPAVGEQVKGLPAPSGRARALDEAVAEIVASVAAEEPTVLFVDDLPRADVESRELILSLPRRITAGPVLLVVTARPGGLGGADELRALRGIKLKPLDVGGVELMLASMLLLAPDDRHRLAERLVGESGGYPFDVIQIVTALVDAGHVTPDAAGVWRLSAAARSARLPIPDAVRDAVRSRVSGLSARARNVLDVAALLARPVDGAIVGELLRADPAIVGDGIAELLARQLIREGPARDHAAGQTEYQIAHDLVRRVAIEQVPADRRAALEATIAKSPGVAGRPAAPRPERMLDALEARYTIERVLAEGRVVTTHAARDARDGREVELHVVRGAALSGAERFLRTFERVAALSDPRVVPIVDFGVTPDALFYATERAGGPTLRERLVRERPLPVATSLALAADLARALGAAHDRGIVHGDLRPKYVTITPRGAVLAGLGVVDALGALPGGTDPEGTGVTIGAPAYLSPEQLTGEAEVDARSDIYSLGTLLYEMLAGERPFVGSHQALIARKLTQPAPSVRERRDSVPKQVDRLLKKCLARVPADRYASVGEVLEALEAVGGVR